MRYIILDFEQADTTQRYLYEPHDHLNDNGEAFVEFFDSGKGRKNELPHIPTFAQGMLTVLKERGLLHRTDTEPPRNVRRVKLDKGQDLWIRFDTHRNPREGYMDVEVLDAPRSDGAILAAMLAWTGQLVDFEQVLEAFCCLFSAEGTAQYEKIEKSMNRMYDRAEGFGFEEWKATFESLIDLGNKIETAKYYTFIRLLLRYYKPEVESYSPQELNSLMEKTSSYINDFLESLRKLQAFLEYGTPNRNLAPAIKKPNRDVKAAVLHDVNGFNYRQIGERMGIPPSPDFEIKGEHQTIRKMVQRGQRILEGAFGKEGWREQVETMKTQKAWWQSLSAEERKRAWA